jgi:hypothetical protein
VSLVINVTYDSSVNSAPAGFKTAVQAAVAFFEQTFTNNVTLNITFGWAALSGNALAENSFYYNTYTYAQMKSLLTASATSQDDATAYATLPGTDPTPGGNSTWALTVGQEKALGISVSAPYDDYVQLNSNVAWTFDPANRAIAGEYDAVGAIEHEISEGGFGRVGGLDLSGFYTPLDLFRYSSPGVRDFSPGTNDYFSIDGTHLLEEFNNHNQFGGDVSDWYPTIKGDSFGDGYAGVEGAVTPVDLSVLDVLGWNKASVDQTLKFVGTGDFDGNGQSDLLWQSSGQGVLWLDNGENFVQVTIPNASMGAEWAANGIGHDSNGTKEIFWSDGSGGDVAIWKVSGGTLSSASIVSGHMGAEWSIVGEGDFDGNGSTDVLWQSASGSVEAWLMNGAALASFPTSNLTVSSGSHVVAVGDFFGTGHDSVLWENAGDLTSWSMNGATVGAQVNVGHMGAEWHVAGVGDFLNDGAVDIVWVDTANDVQIWKMNNGVISQFINPAGHDGTEWQLKAVADFTGNGNSDLLWIRSDGAANLWQINGTQVSSSLFSTPPGNLLQLSSPGVAIQNAAAASVGSTSQTPLYYDGIDSPTSSVPDHHLQAQLDHHWLI